MNCREFSLLVRELARDESPNAAASQHAEHCAGCAAQLAAERVLCADVRLVVAELARHAAPPRVEANLLAALHAQTERGRDVAPPWWSWRFAAVALLVLVAGLWWRNTRHVPPKQEARQTPAQPNQSDAPTLPTLVDGAAPRVDSHDATRRPLRHGKRQPRSPLGEAALPFYSLVAEGEMPPLESARIVRVELTAPLLITLGLPVTAEHFTQPVEAELLLGQDGLARAIRFVPAGQNTAAQ